MFGRYLVTLHAMLDNHRIVVVTIAFIIPKKECNMGHNKASPLEAEAKLPLALISTVRSSKTC